jgi:hypothetical protein
MDNNSLSGYAKIPNFFYDLIVFMTPSLTLLSGILCGLGFNNSHFLCDNFSIMKFTGIDSAFLIIAGFFVLLLIAYEYGRLAEALSTCIGTMILYLRSRKLLFTKQPDYSIDFKNAINMLNLTESLDDKRMDKWTIFFYALRFQPIIGIDILKRYAWEKLSRSSAFTFGVLFLISSSLGIMKLLHIHNIFNYYILEMGVFGFGSLIYNISVDALGIMI